MASMGGFPGQNSTHELNVYLAGALRARVCAAMWAEMNIWMHDFALATHWIAKGLVDGTLPEDVVNSYPYGTEYPTDLSREIAHLIGLPFADEPDEYPEGSGWLLNIGDEAVGVGIAALRGITAADVDTNDVNDGCVWSFYPETLIECGVTVEQIRQVMGGLSLLDSARLLVDANNSRY